MDTLVPTKPNSPFEVDLNAAGMAARFDNSSNIAQTLFGGAVASVVDFGASLWNSMPLTPEVSTHELLAKISDDALQVYTEHPDAIHTASFIGGVFVPAGLAMKGMNLLRSGSKSVNWFTNAGRQEDLARATKIFAEAGKETAAYRTAVRELYTKSAVNQAIDAVAAEAAIVFAMNAHPFMEDYLKDPVQNMAIGVVGGSVLGAGIAHVADRFIVKNAMSEVFSNAFDTARAGVKMVEPGMTGAVALQTHSENVKNLTKLIEDYEKAGKMESSDLTVRIAKNMLTAANKDRLELFDAMVSPQIRALPVDEKTTILQTLSKHFEMHGVDSVSLSVPSAGRSNVMISADNKSLTTAAPVLTRQVLHKTGNVSIAEKEAVFYPDLGIYAQKGSEVHFGNVNTLYRNIDAAATPVSKTAHQSPNWDSTIELMGVSAPESQADVIGKIKKWDELSSKELSNALFANSDLNGLTAILAKMRKTGSDTEIRVVDKSLYYHAQLQQKIVQQGPLTKKYTDAMEAIFSPTALHQKGFINVLYDSTVSQELKNAVTKWTHGNQWPLQKGSVAYFARGYSKGGLTDKAVDNERKLFQELYESESSRKAREKFRQVADSDGYVFLYRGTGTRDLKGSAPLESMTVTYDKANEFTAKRHHNNGVVNLYRIHVDDIVAVFHDTVGGAAANQTEVMVRASAREAKVSIDSKGNVLHQQAVTQRIIQKPDNIRKVKSGDVELMIRQARSEHLNTLISNAIPLESIALRTNTPKWLVEAYAADGGAGPQVLERLLAQAKASGVGDVDFATGSAISDLRTAEAAFGAKHTPLILKGNMRKNPYIQAHSGLDQKTMRDINKAFIDAILAGSKSQIVKEWGDFMSSNRAMFDMMDSMLGLVNTEAAGNRFFNSVDFWARNMRDLGPIVSAVGKQVQHLSNAMIGRIATPIQDAMEAVAKDPAAIIEFATAKHVNDGLRGWRKFDSESGQFFQMAVDEKGKPIAKAVEYQGQPYTVTTPAVRKALSAMQDQGKELLGLHNASRKIKGQQDVNDINLWIPTFNPANKYIAYLHNMADDTTKIIYANTKDAYNELIMLHKQHIESQGLQKEMRVIERGEERDLWSMLNGRMDPFTMERADVGQLKKGSAASANITADLTIFGEIIGGYEHYITSQMRNLVELTMSDVTFTLDRLSRLAQQGNAGMPLTKVKQVVERAKDPAATMRNVLTGSTSLDEYSGWKEANRSFETILSYGVKAVNTVFEGALKPLTSTFFGKAKPVSPEDMRKLDYQKISEELKNRGIVNPWEIYDTDTAEKLYQQSKLADSPDISKRIVYAGNALAATVALRVGELAQPLVNIMSLPILTHLAAANKMPEHFLGVKKGTAKVTPVQVMFEGARAANSTHWKRFDKMWEEAGYYDAMVSEVNTTLQMSRSLDRGAIAATERALDSSIVKIFSTASDWSESFVRRQTMFTGAVLAKRLYPELDDAGVTIFARDFMDKAVGNFHAPQRPTVFQGTMGVALGLFQTYALTFGQSLYRHLELKNYKELGIAALLQSSIFGTGSLPGFMAVSRLIGEHFSDDHVDLETGTFRALPDPMAEAILYGLPSQLGVGTHTRGDANFRIPSLTTDGIVALNFSKQAMTSIMQVADAVGSADKSVPQAFAEALSLQSMSRPLARGAELAMGYSITQKGNTVSTPEEVWTFAGIAARVLGTRPMEELKLRNAIHLNTYYGAVDYENRQSLMSDIKTKIRAGVLTEEDIAQASLKYLERGGTPTGWRAAIAKALGTTETDGKEELVHKLRPDSPLMYMVNSLDGYGN